MTRFGPILALLLAPAAWGEALTLPDALALARAHNHDLMAARARLNQSRVGVEQAWTALLPTANAQGRYTHNYKGAELDFGAFGGPLPPGIPTSVTIQKEEQLDASLTVTVPLLSAANIVNLSSSKSAFAASQASFQVTQTSLLLSVAQAFYAAAGADELLLARSHAVDVSQKTMQISRAKLAAGTAKRTDVNQAELALLRAQQALLEAKDTQRQSRRSLATLLQTPEPLDIRTGAITPPTETADALTQRAYNTRPELRAYAATIDADKGQMHAADWRWAPTLSGFGQGKVGNYASFTGDKYSWALGLQLDWALFDSGARTAQRHLAESQLAETEAHLAAERDNIRDEIRTALDAFDTKRAAVVTAQESVQLAQETLKLTRAEYDAGTATQLDVLQAQDSLVGAEVSQAQARFDLALARLSLDRSVGDFPEGRP